MTERTASRLFLLMALLSPVATAAAAADRPTQPNVLLIVSEDNGPELGCQLLQLSDAA